MNFVTPAPPVTRPRSRSTFTCVCLTIALPVAALLLSVWLKEQLSASFEPLLTASVAAVCWFFGRYYGVAALILCSLILDYFFLSPREGFTIRDLNAALRLGLFFGANAL